MFEDIKADFTQQHNWRRPACFYQQSGASASRYRNLKEERLEQNPPGPTFSPCSDGTESRRLWKLSLMWSLRLRSSALWCARLSACNNNRTRLQRVHALAVSPTPEPETRVYPSVRLRECQRGSD